MTQDLVTDIPTTTPDADEAVPLGRLPVTLLERITNEIANYSLGFVRLTDGPHGEDAAQAGSGTLIAVGQKRAILTAHHVIEKLPRRGRLGLILSPTRQSYALEASGVTFIKIARGPDEPNGPDLAAIVLPPDIASSIGAIKSFYNLDKRRERMLTAPPERDLGIWCVNGFIDERTQHEPGEAGFRKIVRFYNLTGFGGADAAFYIDGYDYHRFPVSYGGRSVAPVEFKGMSGGGLWQIPLQRHPNGELSHQTPLLSGLVFYQVPTTETEAGVTCHGSKSIYHFVYDAIQTPPT